MDQENNKQIYFTCAILDDARSFDELDTAQQLQTNFLSLCMGQSEELLRSARESIVNPSCYLKGYHHVLII